MMWGRSEVSVNDHLLYASPHGYALYFLASTNKQGDYYLKGPVFEHIFWVLSPRFQLLQIQMKFEYIDLEINGSVLALL